MAAFPRPGEVLTTSTGLVLFVADPYTPNRMFWAYVKPTIDSRGNTVEPNVSLVDTGTAYQLRVSAGLVYIIGSMPWVLDDIIETSSEGTAYILNVFSNSDGSRDSGGSKVAQVYSVEINPDPTKPLRVWTSPPGPNPVDVTAANLFVAASKPNATTPITIAAPVAVTPGQQAWMQALITEAEAAGLPHHN